MMRLTGSILGALFFVSACGGGDSEPGGSADTGRAAADRGGTISIGGETWTFVPSIACFLHPNGEEISIGGHAKENPELEISLDWGQAKSIYVAPSDAARGWHAVRDTIEISIDGRRVTGSATFAEYFTGTGDRADGTFDFQC